jgi:hypothetical protein
VKIKGLSDRRSRVATGVITQTNSHSQKPVIVMRRFKFLVLHHLLDANKHAWKLYNVLITENHICIRICSIVNAFLRKLINFLLCTITRTFHELDSQLRKAFFVYILFSVCKQFIENGKHFINIAFVMNIIDYNTATYLM